MTKNCFISSPSSSSSSWRRYNLFFNGNVIIYLYIFLALFFWSSGACDLCGFFFYSFLVGKQCAKKYTFSSMWKRERIKWISFFFFCCYYHYYGYCLTPHNYKLNNFSDQLFYLCVNPQIRLITYFYNWNGPADVVFFCGCWKFIFGLSEMFVCVCVLIPFNTSDFRCS